MRRLLAVLAVAFAASWPTPAHAGPADAVPLSFGTYVGVMDCDTGSCWGTLDLTGRFAIGSTGSMATTATLTWSGRDDVLAWYGTITSPRFTGSCRIDPYTVNVDPLVSVRYTRAVDCSVVVDGGLGGGDLHFLFEPDPNLDVSDTSPEHTGRYFPPADPFAYYPL